MNYQYQTYHQKQSQTPGTDYYQGTYILIQIFLPFQDHTRCITRPSTHSHTESKTEEPYTPKHFTVSSIGLHKHSNTTIGDEQSHLDNTSEDEITSVPTDKEHTVTMPPARTCPIPAPRPSKVTNDKETSANNQLKYICTHSQPEKYHYYLCQQCQLNNLGQEHSFQDHHNATATDASIIHTFQDHRMHQSSRNNDHHYYHHHTSYQHFLDHTPPTQGHFILQVSTYIPVLLPYPSQLITLLQYYTT